MIDILKAVGDRGERAFRRTLYGVAGALLLVSALAFASAAIVEALTALMPRHAALGLGALFLLFAALVCFFFARPKAAPHAPALAQAANAPRAFTAPGDWRSALHLALIEEAQERPARAAALAALAGLVLGALEGFDEAGKEKPHDA
jgi:FtsH-binding integral membrane protein